LTTKRKRFIFITALYNTVIRRKVNLTKPIEGVSERILSCAKEGFLEKGYADASLRTIAAKAETTTGSIYSRFRDKEGLFGALVEPAAGGRTLEILNESDYEYSLNGNKQTNN
jgi:AcrR family transcriptional regulator